MSNAKIAKEHKYENLKRLIVEGIESGKYPPNSRLPSENEFVSMFGTSHITVRKALSDLVVEGKIFRVQGKGSFVNPEEDKNPQTGAVVSHSIFSGEQYDSAFVGIIQGAGKYMKQEGIYVRLDFMDEGIENENAYIHNLIEEKSKGALLFLSEPEANREALCALDAANIPFVLIDRNVRSYQANYVSSNNISGAYMQVRHLAMLGHKKIGFVTYNMSLNTERERHSGFIEGMMDFSPGEKYNVFSAESFEDEAVPMIESGDLTALAVVNDRTAVGIIRRLEKLGISVPEDISIIGFDDWEPARCMNPALTTVRQDFIAIGWQSARLLYEAMCDSSVRGRTVLNPVMLIERESTCFAKTDNRRGV